MSKCDLSSSVNNPLWTKDGLDQTLFTPRAPCYHLSMRILIISDIHANLTALDAVLADTGSFETVWCLGDLVGYGPDPNECIERVREFPDLLCLIGNHDQAALGIIPLSRFNREAGAIAAWTGQILTKQNIEYLNSLPTKITLDDFTLAHGSPNQPVWEYILDPGTADRSFDALKTPYGIVGHTHLPTVFHRPPNGNFSKLKSIQWDAAMPLDPDMLLNPGSVGQPRDRDPRASYAILDSEAKTWEMFRVDYDITQVQIRILKAGLPERQALRLTAGW